MLLLPAFVVLWGGDQGDLQVTCVSESAGEQKSNAPRYIQEAWYSSPSMSLDMCLHQVSTGLQTRQQCFRNLWII